MIKVIILTQSGDHLKLCVVRDAADHASVISHCNKIIGVKLHGQNGLSVSALPIFDLIHRISSNTSRVSSKCRPRIKAGGFALPSANKRRVSNKRRVKDTNKLHAD